MGYGLLGGVLRPITPVKHKIFVSYHHGGDQAYYDAFSQTFHNTYDVIYDNSLERRIDSGNVDYIMRQIRENHITGTSCTIVLIGAQTWRRKYVDWEIKATLDKQHALIGVYLPTAARDPANNNVIIVPDRLHDNIQSGFAVWLSWENLTSSAAQLEQHIATAKSRSKQLIDNSRERMLRNA